MLRCKICYSKTMVGTLCDNDICKKISLETRKRVVQQTRQFNEIMGNDREKECKSDGCNEIIVYPKQYCEQCRIVRVKASKEKDRLKRHTPKVCKGCNTIIHEPKANSQQYCGEECRPTYKRPTKQVRKITKPKKKKKEKESGIDPYFLRRGKISNTKSGGGYSTVD